MNVVMLNVVLVLSIFVVNIASQSLNCGDLPRVAIPSIEVLIANSPLQVDKTLTSTFRCTTVVFTKPARGTTGYDGTVLSVSGSKVIAFDYTVGSDGKTLEVTVCITGQKSTWYAAVNDFDANGGAFTLYKCNGTALEEFVSGSNDGRTSTDQQNALEKAQQVVNGAEIQDAQSTSCPGRKGCQVF